MSDALEPWSTHPTDVVLEVPAVATSLRVVRMVAAAIAADAGFDVDEVDDVRMAVDELCAALVESEPPSPARVRFRLEVDRLSVRAETASADAARAPVVDDLRAAVLGATADHHGFASAGGRSVAWLEKRSAAVAAAGRGHADR